jgi:hypothetical protein
VGPDPHRKVPDPRTYGPDLRIRSRTSTGVPGPLERVPNPPVQGPGHSQQCPGIPGQRIHRPWSRSGGAPEPTRVWTIPRTLPLPAQAETRCCRVPTAHDINQRAEPDVRLLGHASFAFIADKTRRLTGDVPPRHLMSHVHSTDRRCAASTFNVPCPLRWRVATGPSCRRRAYPFRWQAIRMCCGVHCAHCHSYVVREASAARQCYADRRYQGARRLHWRLALVAPSITSVMFLGPHVGAQHPCTCPRRRVGKATHKQEQILTDKSYLIDSSQMYLTKTKVITSAIKRGPSLISIGMSYSTSVGSR